MRKWLQLDDLTLAQQIDYSEKNDPESDTTLNDFAAARSLLSRLAWDAYAAALNCDSGPISKTGVTIHPLSRPLAAALLQAFEQSKPQPLRRDDFAIGYVANRTQSICDHLNRANQYRELTDGMTSALEAALLELAATIETDVGHPFRIVSTRVFQLTPGTGIEGRHLDGWPPSIRKVFLLPLGASRKTGTTWFRGRDGKEVTVESDGPLMVVFENSVALHAPQPAMAERPTIELDIAPATVTDPTPYYAGNNGWYPWFPTEQVLLAGTRMAARIAGAKEARGMWKRLLFR